MKEGRVKDLIRLEDIIKLIMINDITQRKYLEKNHRSYIPDRGVYTIDYADDGSPVYHILSRQMVIFCVERRKAWRILQSRAGIENKDYLAQKELLTKIDKGELSVEDFLNNNVDV
ncbi:MAG: hypothetical protein IIA49_02645, partial [Bacteroidetes bacterium]|nr:hypothetical protein [Bacteroidota bacterium]